jgi:hypothetical protein
MSLIIVRALARTRRVEKLFFLYQIGSIRRARGFLLENSSHRQGGLNDRIPSEFQLKSFLIDATVYGCLKVFLLPFPEKFGGTHER